MRIIDDAVNCSAAKEAYTSRNKATEKWPNKTAQFITLFLHEYIQFTRLPSCLWFTYI